MLPLTWPAQLLLQAAHQRVAGQRRGGAGFGVVAAAVLEQGVGGVVGRRKCGEVALQAAGVGSDAQGDLGAFGGLGQVEHHARHDVGDGIGTGGALEAVHAHQRVGSGHLLGQPAGDAGAKGKRAQAGVAGTDGQCALGAGVDGIEHQVLAIVGGDHAGSDALAAGRLVDGCGDVGELVGAADVHGDAFVAVANGQRAAANGGIGGECARGQFLRAGQRHHFHRVVTRRRRAGGGGGKAGIGRDAGLVGIGVGTADHLVQRRLERGHAALDLADRRQLRGGGGAGLVDACLFRILLTGHQGGHHGGDIQPGAGRTDHRCHVAFLVWASGRRMHGITRRVSAASGRT